MAGNLCCLPLCIIMSWQLEDFGASSCVSAFLLSVSCAFEGSMSGMNAAPVLIIDVAQWL